MISVVIPFYNEQENLPELAARLAAAASTWNEDYEVIAVDDGSRDATPTILAELHRNDPRWRVLTFSRNFGHQTAVSAGIHFSRGDAVAVLDGDLQDPPEELARFLARLREGHQVVYAVRTKRQENAFKRASYKLFYRLLKRAASIDVPLDSGDFCVMDRTVVDVLRAMPERHRFVRGLRSWTGFRQVGLEYERPARFAGQPKYTFSKLVRLALDGILSFSNAPLRLASLAGCTLCGASIVLMVLLVIWALSDVPIFGMKPRAAAGWTSLASLILLLSGMQFLMLGVIGEYLARVFDEVHARPPWVIAQALGFDKEALRGQPGWFVRDGDVSGS